MNFKKNKKIIIFFSFFYYYENIFSFVSRYTNGILKQSQLFFDIDFFFEANSAAKSSPFILRAEVSFCHVF